MPIVDNELLGEVTEEEPLPSLPVGEALHRLLKKNLNQLGDAPWMTDLSTGKSMSYSQLLDAIDRVASALKRRGLKANDVVLVMASNHVETAVFFLSVWRAGGINACLTLSLLPEEIARRAAEVGAKFVLTDALRAGRVVEATAPIDSVLQVFVIGQHDGCASYDDLLQHPADVISEESDIKGGDMAWLMYSSGTTGVSKGIVHTQDNIMRMFSKNYTAVYAHRKVLFINYIINSGGMVMAVYHTTGHAHLLVMSDFSDEKLLPAIHDHKPQYVNVFPSQIAYICRHPELDQFDLSSVVVFTTTGSTINPVYERQIYDKVPRLIKLGMAYGMSEVGLITSNSVGQKPITSKEEAIAAHVIGSVGKLMPNNRLKVIDPETGRKLGPGEIGELCVLTHFMMKEYLNRPDETAKTVIDGWLHTGDKGYYDTDENVFVIGRYKELIKYRMAHVVPTNIEKYLMTHPAVEDVAVVGQPHDVDGELPTAFVVVRTGQSTTAEEIVRFIQERVVDEERLRGGVRFTGKIPRNTFGKIVRHQLKLMLPA